jgi:hypothetical protein
MAKKTVVLNLKNLPKRLSDPLYIGRGSDWGNPFYISKTCDRETSIRKFRQHLWRTPSLMQRLPELRGKQLLCFCAPEKCHGDVLVAALAWSDAHQSEAVTLGTEADTRHERAAL